MTSSTTTNSEAVQTDLDQFIIRNVEEMAFEPSEWEVKTLLEVLALPRVTVTRPPEEQLLAVGMRPNDCHANCAAQVANDTEGRSCHVLGWYIHGSDLILPSVVDIGGDWYCLTPQTTSLPSRFQFIPDDQIEWRVSFDVMGMDAFRGGMPLPLALRKYPHVHVPMRNEFMALIAAGLAAMDARDRVAASWGAEFRKLDPIR
ncbi:hypothetical protein ACFSE1_06145 [Rhizobium helianthi]|uniref:Uncharacterized protein n=1 Tax=Rhizobium helianthi TaxID=1132695 RepID=A0ABW4M0T5_9HYPH